MLLFAGDGGHHTPLIVEFVNHYLGEPIYNFQLNYTKPIWDKFFANFGTDAETVFGVPYSPENAIPWYTVMFFIACGLSVLVIWLLKGKLSEDDPTGGQMTLEAGFLALKDLIISVVGYHGFRYFPVVATFAVLVLISNLMATFPLFMAPTASVNVTFALGIASFVYYNYVGISENGFLKHIGHLAGPRLPLIVGIFITPLIFSIELISNMIRPMTLGVRLFANMFADEQIYLSITNLAPPYTQILIPAFLLVIAVFVSFVQTLVFTLLSMIYISEVTHPDDHHDDEHSDASHTEVAPATA
ncbi:F0F1 ATP synthase subunit A [Leptolyngbya sp. 7M]|uniref:F0F1 ATP synthase subunit A n=1 Tax=Leptolyngbya sp. 7M TaxID=2812896 RepID=UPI001B8C570F|nr:F0F1 ATP synthase subunit A [Leptolyngbya sp. 7M]QYO67797.1 F0F1 ATP synthase subunit A [Leptolyngbya sp. 7M]